MITNGCWLTEVALTKHNSSHYQADDVSSSAPLSGSSGEDGPDAVIVWNIFKYPTWSTKKRGFER